MTEKRGERYGKEQNDDQNIFELLGQDRPWRHAMGFSQFIGAVFGQSALRLRRAQSMISGAAEVTQHFSHVLLMPCR